MKTYLTPIFILSLLLSCSGKKNTSEEWKLVYESNFSKPLDPDIWKVEMDPQPNSSVQASNGKLLLDTKGGVTVWLNKILKGDIEITYRRKVLVDGAKNDRLSDLNQFWMATDPHHKNFFTRSGKFPEYDSLSMYYVGFGGNYNSTTRFRKYQGNGERTLLVELNGQNHLLKPNHEYQIKIRVQNGEVSFWVDGKRYFHYKDENPLQHGYFGFRSTWSRQEIDDLKIYQKK